MPKFIKTEDAKLLEWQKVNNIFQMVLLVTYYSLLHPSCVSPNEVPEQGSRKILENWNREKSGSSVLLNNLVFKDKEEKYSILL